MFKKILKVGLVCSLLITLSGCGKKMTTDEIYENSITNFQNVQDYYMNMNASFKLSSSGADIISLKTNPSYNIDNVSQTAIKKDKTSMFFLFFRDDSSDIIYEDFKNSVKYTISEDSSEIKKEELDSISNPSYVLNVLFRNGVLLNGDCTEYSDNGTDFYVIPLVMNYETMGTFFSSLNPAENMDALSEMGINVNSLTDEQKAKFKDTYINIDYLVYKDSLLPAMIQIDSESMKEFASVLSSVIAESDSAQMLSLDDSETMDLSVSIDDISISFGNYMSGQEILIPENIIANAVEEKDGFGDFSFSNNSEVEDYTEEDYTDEDYTDEDSFVEEDLSEEETESFNYKEAGFDTFSFNLNDEIFEFPLLASSLVDAGFILEELEEDSISPNSYSVPIGVYNEDNDVLFYITVMNDSDISMKVEDCSIIRVEFDSLDKLDDLKVSGDIGFDSDIRDLKYIFDDESFVYEGDLSTVYTYQFDEKKYIDFQVDNESGKVCFISITYM